VNGAQAQGGKSETWQKPEISKQKLAGQLSPQYNTRELTLSFNISDG